jgi:hypothetical protein
MGRFCDTFGAEDFLHEKHVLAVEYYKLGILTSTADNVNVAAFEACEREFLEFMRLSWNVRRAVHTLYP